MKDIRAAQYRLEDIAYCVPLDNIFKVSGNISIKELNRLIEQNWMGLEDNIYFHYNCPDFGSWDSYYCFDKNGEFQEFETIEEYLQWRQEEIDKEQKWLNREKKF